jgi:branched-subunit amino acid ABC-type transport system permease component
VSSSGNEFRLRLRGVLAFAWGVAESLGGANVSLEFKTSLAFILIVVVLLARPEGLLGKEFQERV